MPDHRRQKIHPPKARESPPSFITHFIFLLAPTLRMMQTRSCSKRSTGQGPGPSRAGIPIRNDFQRNYAFHFFDRVPPPIQPSSPPDAPVEGRQETKRYQSSMDANLRASLEVCCGVCRDGMILHRFETYTELTRDIPDPVKADFHDICGDLRSTTLVDRLHQLDILAKSVPATTGTTLQKTITGTRGQSGTDQGVEGRGAPKCF
ncbi:unnamed protein product [Chrysoparadoxa australica]